uniref:ciliary-associated calcium-binding coiled-coil protein 1 n=1 Tax=Semicossyphus pulcher TaxID=241346 RepID=UPI0037E94160
MSLTSVSPQCSISELGPAAPTDPLLHAKGEEEESNEEEEDEGAGVQLQQELKQIFGFRNLQTCLKEASLLDFYVTGFWWTKTMNFNPKQTSFIMALFQRMMNNIQEKGMVLVENLLEFSEALSAACQCSSSVDETTSLLCREEANSLTCFMKNSLFQKHEIYQLLFTTTRDELLTGAQRNVEVFSHQSISPLEEGISAHLTHLQRSHLYTE